MAARRLIAVLLVLLFLSSLATALAPVERTAEQATEEEAASEPADPLDRSPARGALIRESIDTSDRLPSPIDASRGDQLQLRITSPRAGTIELVGLGETEDVGPDAPALFDVLLDNRGEFAIRFLESREQIATILVADDLLQPVSSP